HLQFTLSQNSDKYWHSASDIKTYHFNALAIFLPQLEKMLVLSLKKGLRDVTCPILKAEVASLVAQEAIHGRVFHRYSEKLVFQHY
ncbi:MAG TPA: metal-dependent hydrolase, partial [Candidatus Berkiella sp.]|nr:metal-dependent hydrolase [Candidatus Berkiella sp.]